MSRKVLFVNAPSGAGQREYAEGLRAQGLELFGLDRGASSTFWEFPMAGSIFFQMGARSLGHVAGAVRRIKETGIKEAVIFFDNEELAGRENIKLFLMLASVKVTGVGPAGVPGEVGAGEVLLGLLRKLLLLGWCRSLLNEKILTPGAYDAARRMKWRFLRAARPGRAGGRAFISVITPDYNRTDQLRNAVLSVIDQPYPNYELIIVLDGSTEECRDVAFEFIDHPKVKIFEMPENSGNACLPRNVGIKEASYDFITFQDSDDLMHPGKLFVLPEIMGDADMAYGNSVISEEGHSFVAPTFQTGLERSLRGNSIMINTVVLKKKALMAVGGFKPRMRYMEDYELWCRLMYHGFKVRYVKGVFGIYNVHARNLEKTFKPDEGRWKKLLLDEYRNIPEGLALPAYRRLRPEDVKRPRVSVVIPCHNHAGYLPEAVESVARQTYWDLEVIIVNDGSTDDTAGVAARLKEKYPGLKVKLINQENLGPSAARNRGIAAAMGEYILPLDADDILAPAFLEETVKVLDSTPGVSVAYTDWAMFGEVPDEFDGAPTAEEYDIGNLLDHNFIVCTSLYRKSAWKEAGGYKEEMSRGYEDWEFWITLAGLGHAGRLVNEPLFLYRKHGRSRNDLAIKAGREIKYRIRKLHLELYYPGIYRFGRQAALAANFVKWHVRDPISAYLFRNFRGLHTFLKTVRDGLKVKKPCLK